MINMTAAVGCGLACMLALKAAAEPQPQNEGVALDEMTVSAAKEAPFFADVPTPVETVTDSQIKDNINAVTSAETLKYLPSVQVRERYVGDRNAIIATRTVGAVSSAQTLLYADGMLLSNLLGNSFAYPPRWGMVTPEEISSVEMIYGPYSAMFPGNSMGGVVNISTRVPEKLEAHASVQQIYQHFKLFGARENNTSTHASASAGDRVGDFTFWVGADHLQSEGQPMSFATATTPTTGSGTPVTGFYRDTSEKGQPRLVFGGYSIDHSTQDSGKIKLAYDITPAMKATYTLGLWQLNSNTEVDSYLTNSATGAKFYNGNVRIDGKTYKVSGLNPTHSDAFHIMQGLDVRTNNSGAWDWQLLLSDYDYRSDKTRNSTAPDPSTSMAGTIQDMSGTGWFAGDLRGEWRPGFANGAHKVSFGYHYDHYQLDSTTYNTTNWRHGGNSSVNNSSAGDTRTQALYAQDAWAFDPRWKLTLGGRWEHWQAYNGQNQARFNGGLKTSHYASKSDHYFSPKATLTFDPTPAWGLRASFGKAYRFPTVTELYQSITNAGTLVVNNPDLKPEKILSGELAAERRFSNGLLRLSVFQEDRHDALYSQTVTYGASACGTNQCSYIQNVDKVRFRGAELAGQFQDVALRGLDLNGSLTYVDAEILKDDAHPDYQGNKPTRIPDWVGKAVATYHQGESLTYSLAARFSGRQYYYLDNSDTNPGVYNSASKYFFIDAKANYQFANRWTASAGVDNLNNYKAYVLHPYPQRTWYAQLKFDY